MSMREIELLDTEKENINTKDIDLLSTSELLDRLNTEDMLPAIAVRRVLPQIAVAVDEIARRFSHGGRILYTGAGTSGRIAFMDAAECPPTFGIDFDRISVAMAGGKDAVFRAKEGFEDKDTDGEKAVLDWKPTEKDCVIGIASSGRTPFVLSSLKCAKELGAYTVFICANTVPSDIADSVIICLTGAEALTGSTRLKAGTAAKMIINMISTSVMIKCGRTYGNFMCYIKSSNGKLSARSVITLCKCCEISEERANELLTETDGNMALSLTMGLSGSDMEGAKKALLQAEGRVRGAVEILRGKRK